MSQEQDTNGGGTSQAVPETSNNITAIRGRFHPRRAVAAAASMSTPAKAGAAQPAETAKKKRPNPVKVWCDSALNGGFGEFAAERLENGTLVRRWNGSYWELMSENDGYATATEWMDRRFPDDLSSGKARDCWKTLTGLLHKQRPLRAVDPGHVVFPLLDGYLHIEEGECRLEAPERAFGLTHQVRASAGIAHGEVFLPAEVPLNSLFGRYLATSLPDPKVRALIQEQCALSFLPNKFQQVAWWVGDGGAGKGTLSKLLLRFHSKSATVDLHKLADPHHLEPLVGATFVMVDEVEQKGRWAEKEFKSIVSGDVFTVKLRQCPCGSDLTTWRALPASAALCELMELMRFQVYRGHVDLECPATLLPLKDLDLRQLCKLTWVMSSTLHFVGEQKRHKPKSRLRYDAEAERVAVALAHWPMGFQALLQEMYGQTLLAAEALPPFHKCFSWVFARLIKNDPGDGQAYSFVASEVFKFGANYWTHRALSRAGRDPNAPAPEAMRWGTVGEAAQILGLHMVTMKKLIDAGEIPVRRVSLSGSRPFIVDLDWARRQRFTVEPAIGMRAAAKVVGVSIKTLRAMVSKGIYVAAHRPAFPGSMSREDTRDLAHRLTQLLEGKKRCRSSDAITLERLFFEAAASPEQKADVFDYLLKNPSLVIGKASGSGMGIAQVQPSALKLVLPQLHDKSSLISLFEAGRMLGCTSAVVTALRRAGHLEEMRYAGRVRVVEASVRRFGRGYESLASICRRLGLIPANAYRRVNFSRLKHIRVQAQRDGHTVFLDRSSVARAEKMLTS